jgi:beta-glucanase (GH16 family)
MFIRELALTVTILATAASAAPLSPPDTLPPASAGQEWKLVWHDEFDGKELDAAKWDVPEYKRRDAWWSRKAVALDGKGHLAIKTLREGGKHYDACVRTKGKYEKAFGYFVARIRLQKSAGHWTAFWMYNNSVGKIGNDGRDGTEIDIMEKPWLDNRVQQTLHWDGYGKQHRSKGNVPKVPGVMKGFHTFALLWTPEEYVFYIDGKETWRTKAGGVCQVPLYLKLSDEAQFKGWAGDVRKANLPDEFLTDYVRVYDLVDKKTGRKVMKAKPLENTR